MTGAEIKSQRPNLWGHPGAPKQNFLIKLVILSLMKIYFFSVFSHFMRI